MMNNRVPTSAGFYCEDNIYDHCYGAGEVGVNGMPPNVEMVYTDIGDEVIAGRDLSYCADYDNPCRDTAEQWRCWKISKSIMRSQ